MLDAVQVINAISGLWPIVFPLSAVGIVWILRHRLQQFTVRSGANEAIVSAGQPSQAPETEPRDNEKIISPQQDLVKPDEPAGEISVNQPISTPGDKEDERVTKFVDAVHDSDFDQALVLMNIIISEISNVKDRKDREASMRFVLAEQGHDESLRALEIFSDDTEAGLVACFWLGQLYGNGGSNRKAQEYYRRGIELDGDPKWRTACVKNLSESLCNSQDFDGAIKIVMEELRRSYPDTIQATLYRQLADVYQAAGDEVLRGVALHTAATLVPTSARDRFQAAYHMSQLGNSPMNDYVILVYRLLVKNSTDRSGEGTAINNLGAAYGHAGLTAHKHEMLHEAAKLGATISVGNLAMSLIQSGFLQEAEKVLRTINDIVDVHDNVARAAARISEVRENEAKKIAEIVANGQRIADFLTDFSVAYYHKEAGSVLFGEWTRDGVIGVDVFSVTNDAGATVFEQTGRDLAQRWKVQWRGAAGKGTVESQKYLYGYKDKYWEKSGEILMILESDRTARAMQITKDGAQFHEWSYRGAIVTEEPGNDLPGSAA